MIGSKFYIAEEARITLFGCQSSQNLAHGQCKNSQVTSQAYDLKLIPLARSTVATLYMLDYQIIRLLYH